MTLKKKISLIISLLYLSLLIGFYFGEDLIGGAYNDYKALYYLSGEFKNDFLKTILNYDNFGHRQSPIFFILRSFFFQNELIERILFLHIFLFIPIFFYNSLKIKYKNIDKNILKLLASVILIFPTFRSYSIWPDPHLMGTFFFILSIYFFLKFKYKINFFKNSLFCSISLSLAAYMSPNFGVFIIYYFYEFFKKFGISKNLLKIIVINFILSLPFFIYIFILNVNFIFNKIGWDIGDNFYSLQNISNKILILITIFFFYLIPVINFEYIKKNLKIYFNLDVKNIFLITLILFLFSHFNFIPVFNLTNSGGGFFYRISIYLFNNDYLFFGIVVISFLFISNIVLSNKKNSLLFLSLILSNPQVTIWHANFSPTIFLLIFLLFSDPIINTKLNLKKIFLVFSYYLAYCILNFVKIFYF